ncbi:pirin family protein [Desulfobulbus sp.]|uniref:pirin family protein n=1 Tax=Desulfobulbus sp. TaxID=895 RepID=UPI00286F4B5A|nr:pirin family protein [Desulfobulbus sp.]
MALRTVQDIITGRPGMDGAGVKLTRVLSNGTVKAFDPFLMLDAFDSTNPDDYTRGFPMHPHRGIETLTYLVEGTIEHEDSLGNKGVIHSGCCQWMTAGSGILHQEMPKASPHMFGLQLWINLPRVKKMVSPAYRDITASQIPMLCEASADILVVAGAYKGTPGAAKSDYTHITFLDVTVRPGQTWNLPTDPEKTLFIYTFSGECRVEGTEQLLGPKRAVLCANGDSFSVTASEAGARFVLATGKPLREPVEWGGPIVMNTAEELRTAFIELDEGTFIKHA